MEASENKTTQDSDFPTALYASWAAAALLSFIFLTGVMVISVVLREGNLLTLIALLASMLTTAFGTIVFVRLTVNTIQEQYLQAKQSE